MRWQNQKQKKGKKVINMDINVINNTNEAVDITARIIEHIQILMDNAILTVNDIFKNNDTKLKGLIIREDEGQTIAPTIYLDGYIDAINKGEITEKEAAEMIIESYYSAMDNTPDITDTLDNIKEHLFVNIINTSSNSEMLNNMIHREVEDLSVVVRCRVGNNGSFVVNKDMLGRIGLTASEALEIAENNTLSHETVINSMNEVIAEMTGMNEEMMNEMDIAPPMLVITNKENMYGAVYPFISNEIKQKIADRLGTDEYVILPSSTMEVLAVPVDRGQDLSYFVDMVREVNATHVAPDERLSNNIYHVNTQTMKLTMFDGLTEKVAVSTIATKISSHM